jgi:hypothetical protein
MRATSLVSNGEGIRMILALAVAMVVASTPKVVADSPSSVVERDTVVLARVPTSVFAKAIEVRGIQQDTPTTTRRRHTAIEHTDAYYTRLKIHRYASYAMLPVFVGQYIAGQQLVKYSADAPAWARVGHRVLATTTAGLFTLNTITGAWNWWESRNDGDNKTLRTVHSVSMLVADAGFTTVGMLATPAETNGQLRNLHKQIALGSMGISVMSWLIMLPVFHKEE